MTTKNPILQWTGSVLFEDSIQRLNSHGPKGHMFEPLVKILSSQRSGRTVGPWGARRESTNLGQISRYALKEGVEQKPTDTSTHQDLPYTQPCHTSGQGRWLLMAACRHSQSWFYPNLVCQSTQLWGLGTCKPG